MLRFTHPDLHRPFKTLFAPALPMIDALLCGYLMLNLPLTAWERFAIWLIIGLAIYFLYGRRHSNLAKPAA